MKKIFIVFNIIIVLFLCSFTSPVKTKIYKTSDLKSSITFVENANLYESNIEELLLESGVDEKLVQKYDSYMLEEIATAKNLYITTSLVSQPKPAVIDPDKDFDHVDDNGATTQYKSELTDDYMKITYIVTDLGNSLLKFYIDAVWLKMPTFRFYDSLGAACMNTTVINSSRYGYVEYEIRNNGELVKTEIDDSAMYEAVNGNWYGSACKLPLSTWLEGYPYTEFRIHYEYKGHYNGSNDNPYINTTATYAHQRIALDFTVGITISLTGTPSIGFEDRFLANYEYRIVTFPYDIKVNV